MARRLRRSGEADAFICDMASSLVRLAEDIGERQHKDFVAAVVGDMHDPVAPVFPICGHDVGAGEALGVLAGFDEVADGSATLVDQHVFLVRAMEEDVGHFQILLPNESRKAKFTSARSGGGIRTIPGVPDDLNQTGVMMLLGDTYCSRSRIARSIVRAASSSASASSTSRRGPSRVRTADTVMAATGRCSDVLIQVDIDFVPWIRPTSRRLKPRRRAAATCASTVGASVREAANRAWLAAMIFRASVAGIA